MLTNRLVPLGATPLAAREFWQLVERVDPADLLHADVAAIAELASVDTDEAARLRTLLDAATAMSFEQERLADGGVSLMCALDELFPARLRERLGDGCPPFLLTAGPVDWLDGPSLGVVGSHDADQPALDVARRAAEVSVEHGWSVVSGLAGAVDHAAMDGAHDLGGAVVGVPGEGISLASRSAAVRRRVHAGELCLASPYAPDAPPRAATAIGRNKIIYALSQVTFVVAAVDGSGGTWSGAKRSDRPALRPGRVVGRQRRAGRQPHARTPRRHPDHRPGATVRRRPAAARAQPGCALLTPLGERWIRAQVDDATRSATVR